MPIILKPISCILDNYMIQSIIGEICNEIRLILLQKQRDTLYDFVSILRKSCKRGCIAFMFNGYNAFRSNIVNRGNEAENFNKYVEATVKALFHSAVLLFMWMYSMIGFIRFARLTKCLRHFQQGDLTV